MTIVMKEFKTLYKKDSKGKFQEWKISVEQTTNGFEIVTRHGKVGGAIQETRDLITEGKNIGKANETTPFAQAASEAESKWIKQQERKGYVQNPESAETDSRPGAEPMLAHRYDKHPEKVVFPAFAQPKLDGHRCIAIVENGVARLFSRQRKQIYGVPHIEAALVALAPPGKKLILDGELYNHAYKNNFEELTGYIRSEQPKNGYKAVQYHVYDLINGLSYYDRLAHINSLFESTWFGPITKVLTVQVDSENEALALFRQFRDEGYEGLMLRNSMSSYEGKRSYNLQKVKEFDDAEFQIIGVTEGRGKMKGHAIFECVTSDGITRFEAKMKGSMEKLKEYFENPSKYIGKWVTIQFQGYTGKHNVPRFPVATRFRED